MKTTDVRINWNQEYFWEIIFMNGKNLVWSSTSGKGILKINRTKIISILITIKFSGVRLIKKWPKKSKQIYSPEHVYMTDIHINSLIWTLKPPLPKSSMYTSFMSTIYLLCHKPQKSCTFYWGVACNFREKWDCE